VANEVSIVIGYPFKAGSEASADVGSTSFALYTQQDGAWIKNAAEEAHMVDAMRAGQTVVIKGGSAKGTQSTDTFALKGLSQALDRIGQECK
jgi:invasion protein IalB